MYAYCRSVRDLDNHLPGSLGIPELPLPSWKTRSTPSTAAASLASSSSAITGDTMVGAGVGGRAVGSFSGRVGEGVG